MRVAILSCGSIFIREKELSWLFGAPEGAKQALDEAGIEKPQVLFTTALRSPGFKDFGQILRLKETPLTMNGVSARPIVRKHGTDYVIDAGHAKVLFSERGDVSVEDTEGYHLAIIKNKHRADAFGDNVITWPWKDSEYIIQDGVTTSLSQEIQLKVWSSMEDVPSNLKVLDGTPLALDQANLIARIAKASGEGGKENWAIGISTFKKSHKKDGGAWVKANANTSEKMMDVKLSQEIANYDPKGGEGIKVCANCEYYCKDMSCVKVDGEIQPVGVCSLWEYGIESDVEPIAYSEAYMALEETNAEGRKAEDYLVVGDKSKPSTWHLPVSNNGELDAHLMGAAAAALTVGYRGNKYEGEDKSTAIAKLLSLYEKSDKEPPANLREARKEYDIVKLIQDAGGNESDIISISVDKETGENYYFNFGDWATETTIEAARKMVGESHFDANAETPPDESKYNIIWQHNRRKEYADNRPIPRIADIITAALHKAYNDTSDKLFQIGYLNQDERMKVAGSIGAGLDAFRKAIEGEEFSNRAVDKWDADQFMQVNKDTYINVFKSKDDNTWRWATITSAAAWDRQGELFTTKAMDWAIGFSKMLTKLTGKSACGPLRYKHIPGFDGGTCDTQVRVGDFLFEAGTFSDSKIGLAMRKKLKEDPAVWQISPGLAFAKHDLINGVYQRAAIFERSMTQRPANPFTIVIHKENGVIEMKILTEQELKSAAEELGLEFEEAKMMYERALAAGGGPLGLKEFTEVVTKATGTNASGFPGGANATHEPEDEAEMLKEAVESLNEEELKHLAELVQATLKAAKTDPDMYDEEDDDDMPAQSKGGKLTPPFAKKTTKDDGVAALKDLIAEQSKLIMQQTKAMGDLAAALAGGAAVQVQQAANDLFTTVPRRQANNFLTTRTKAAGDLPADDAVMQKLNMIEQQLKDQQQSDPMAALYDRFTSTQLNQPKRGAR